MSHRGGRFSIALLYNSTQEKLERLKAKAEERMEESVPYLSDGRTAEEMYRAMVAGGRMDCRPEMEWKPLKERL